MDEEEHDYPGQLQCGPDAGEECEGVRGIFLARPFVEEGALEVVLRLWHESLEVCISFVSCPDEEGFVVRVTHS